MRSRLSLQVVVVGELVGEVLGTMEGLVVGRTVGGADGTAVGADVGAPGNWVGAPVGRDIVGRVLGEAVGIRVGRLDVGSFVVGEKVGDLVGQQTAAHTSLISASAQAKSPALEYDRTRASQLAVPRISSMQSWRLGCLDGMWVGFSVGDVVGRAVVGDVVGLSVQIGRAVEDPPHWPSPVGDGKQVALHTRQHAEVHVDASRVWGHPAYGSVLLSDRSITPPGFAFVSGWPSPSLSQQHSSFSSVIWPPK